MRDLPGEPHIPGDFPLSYRLPSIEELLSSMHVLCLPMNTTFRSITQREVALFSAPNGWVEFSPFLEYDPDEAATWLASALESGWNCEPTPLRHTIPVNATLPDVDPSCIPTVMSRYGNLDYLHTVKVKVGGATSTFERDEARLRMLRSLVGSDVRIRIDVNGAWSLTEAEAHLAYLADLQLEYAEQPVASVEDMARLREILARRRIDIPLAADESIRKARDPFRVAELGAASIIVVKAQPLGGITRLLHIVKATGLPAVVSSALDSAVGIAFGARAAACLPELPYACGLATGALLTHDVIGDPPAPTSSPETREVEPGRICRFLTAAGWVEPDPVALRDRAVSPERYAWWEARVRSAYPLACTFLVEQNANPKIEERMRSLRPRKE